ncbi:hypothetical protein OIU74_017655 [Salix koriyanagi]|uniref:Uncharacterized protein n=1 Tax=Salix koriyanagi TaxID=2511006 RepID=A0A9Q0WQE8_9ROSI|nr:hypothetical protein OIU74_017655 [Salix koriyanagi]
MHAHIYRRCFSLGRARQSRRFGVAAGNDASNYVPAFSAYVTTIVVEKISRWNMRRFLVNCLLFINLSRRSWEIGSLCRAAIKSASQSYFANLFSLPCEI